MRFFNKYFFIGMGSGVLLTVAVIVVIVIIFIKTMSGNIEKMEATLSPPQFPEYSKLSIYGTADYSWSYRTLEGKELMFSELKGKVVFINFWATWCKPCVAEMPAIQNLYDSLKNENIAFLLISNEDEKTIQKFMDEKRFTFPVYLRSKELPKVFKTIGIPATFIISRDGSVVFKHVGSAKWDDESCLSFIRGLM